VRTLLIGLLLVCQMALAQPDAAQGGGNANPFPRAAASYLVQVNGSPLWEKAAAQRLPPASLTKLMTALLVLDHQQSQPQTVVVVSQQATQESGTRLRLRKGERFRVEDLLGAALINSDNDACHALAEHVAGSEAHFIQLMNQRAQQLGMRNTHFANACGHDAADHYSTAQDLAVLANEALKHKLVTDLAAKNSMEITPLGGTRTYKLENKNALLGRYPGVLGLKTGFTPKAGKCLIAYAERGAVRVLLVMLNAPNRWWDATDILDLAFARER